METSQSTLSRFGYGALQPEHCFWKVAEGLDTSTLVAKVNENPELWKENTLRQTFPGTAHHDTETIFLRWAEKMDVASAFTDLKAVDYPAVKKLSPWVRDVGIEVVRALKQEEVGRVMIVNLKPGGSIDEHLDEGKYADYYDRFHLVLSARYGNEFYVGPHSFRGKTGELWWFNHKLLHRVENRSKFDRLHMIVDAVVPNFRFQRNAALRILDESRNPHRSVEGSSTGSQ